LILSGVVVDVAVGGISEEVVIGEVVTHGKEEGEFTTALIALLYVSTMYIFPYESKATPIGFCN